MNPPLAAAVGGRPDLCTLYDKSLAPYLAAEDAPVLRARRNRWIYSSLGLALAFAIGVWAARRLSNPEPGLLVAFALGVGSIFYFFLATGVVSDEIRARLMTLIAEWMGLRYEAAGKGFDLSRFQLFALDRCENVTRHDRLYGTAGGLAFDAVWAHLTDEVSELVNDHRTTRTIERFRGLLVRLADPAPPGVSFRLVPPKAQANGLLRGTSRPIEAGGTGVAPVSLRGFLSHGMTGPADDAASVTGDAAFDQRFELHALPGEVAAAQARLDPPTRAALLDLAGQFGGGPVGVAFDQGDIMLAFVTKQRFEIGPLKPPMADFGRVQHLADQMGILPVIAEMIAATRPK